MPCFVVFKFNMQINTELTALFSLIDDPDEEVFHLISKKIITYGKDVIPCLEDLCETTACNDTQQRINEIIHQVNFETLVSEFQLWNAQQPQDLLLGSTLIARYMHPHLSFEPTLHAVESIQKEIWLELNDFLTSLEMAIIVSNVLFQFRKIESERNNYEHMDRFFLHSILEKSSGNALSTGILYQHLCEQLQIPIRLIDIPDQNVLACFQRNYMDAAPSIPHQQLILFYIDATTGKIFSQADLDCYFELYSVKKEDLYFKPLSNQQILQQLATEVGKCFLLQKQPARKKELDTLAALISKSKINSSFK